LTSFDKHITALTSVKDDMSKIGSPLPSHRGHKKTLTLADLCEATKYCPMGKRLNFYSFPLPFEADGSETQTAIKGALRGSKRR
jgi:hypothetical protein